MEQAVQWYLAEALASARATAGLPDSDEHRPETLAYFGGAIEAFKYLKVLTNDEAQDWFNWMLVAVGITPPDPAPPGVAQAIFVGKRGTESGSAPPAPVSRFVRQVLGPDREFDYFGGQLRVLGVEFYDTATVVRWRVAPEPDISAAFPQEMAQARRDVEGADEWAAEHLTLKAAGELRIRRLYRFELADDVGTEYFTRGASHGGSANGISGEAMFNPTTPPTATMLTFTWQDVAVEIAV